MKKMSAASLVIAAICNMPYAFAETSHQIDTNVIDGNAFQGAKGVIHINTTSGDLNRQSNLTAISVSSQGPAIAVNVNEQPNATDVQYTDSKHASAFIGAHAFSGVSGLLSINQASGQANTQANNIAIGSSTQGVAVADNILDTTAAGHAGQNKKEVDPLMDQHIGIADTAFQGTSGLVQVNQTAGSSNSTANNFALRIAPGVSH